jgi:regulator of cell morphogenesis and NO signaling
MADKYVASDKMSELIEDDFRLLQVISRFGLSLGFGEKTVQNVCDEQGIDCTTFLAVINFTHFGDKSTHSWIERISVKSLTEYLRNAHSYFLDYQLPTIRRKLIEAIDCSSHNEVAFLIIKFFDAYVAEVRKHMEIENTSIFAYIDQLIAGKTEEHKSFEMLMLHQNPVEQKLTELKNIIIRFYNIQGDTNSLNTALYDIYLCEEDLHTHYKMEEILFIPAIRKLEEINQQNPGTNSSENDAEDDSSDTLSEREKEVVSCVVKGLTNKEIADYLFISINTVTTHRRNIARKLDIHSPAGLTIYAIVNKLVDIHDVKDL